MSDDAADRPPTKRLRVMLGALVRLQWYGVVEVPADVTPAECSDVADRAYDMVDAGDYTDDPHYWERGETYVDGELEPGDHDYGQPPDLRLVRDEDGHLVEADDSKEIE